MEKEYKVFRQFLNTEKPRVKIDDRAYCSFCSGGLDSSLMAAVFKCPQLYTAGFKDGVDETDYAKVVANHIGAKHTIVWIEEEDYKNSMTDLIIEKGEPLHPNEPCLYLCAKKAKEDGWDTILSGEGADDLFGGYTDLIENEKKYMKNKEAFLKRYAYEYQDIDIPFEKWKKMGMRKFILEVHTPGLLQRAENACKVAGIKCRFPYIESFVPWMLEGQDLGKTILKQIARWYLPDQITDREKIGFPIPIEDWFGGYKGFLDYNLTLWKNIK